MPLQKTMWILLISICISEVIGESFIMLGDKEFVGPDKRLEEELARRRALSEEDLAVVRALANLTHTEPEPSRPAFDAAPAANYGARRQIETYYNAFGLRSGNSDNFTSTREFMVLQLITFLIYSVKNRLDDLQPILRKYELDERFRYGSIFSKLDVWKTELMTMFQYAHRAWPRRSTHFHLTYYQLMLAKNIDITYSVEFLIYLLNKNRDRQYDIESHD